MTSLLLFIVLCSYYYIAHGGEQHGFVVVQPRSSFESEGVCSVSASRVNLEPSRAAVSMPLVHRHGPCTPWQTTAQKPSFIERLRRSRARAKYIRSRAFKGTSVSTQHDGNVTIPANLGGSVDSLEYVVTLSLGTPAMSQVLLMDTGSDLSWVQCAPCNATACYPQKDPLFDPSKSSTYAPIPCDTDTCRNLTVFYRDGCTSGGAQCAFAIEYGDGSHTRGVYSKDTLTLAPEVTVKDFHFGCANDQDGQNDKYDGLIGLGGAPESLVGQASSVYGGAFSYCLPAQNGEAGFLTLGAASTNTSGFVFTPMKREFGIYLVNLTGISVGGKQLDLPPSVFSKGMLVDSGTVATELPATAYSALRTAFRSAMSAYPLLPPNDELGVDTCYNFTGFSNVTVPTVSLTFDGGATIDLDVPNGVLVEDCLVFQESGPPDDVPGILGSVNQRTFEVLYDVGHG
nr:unnamed protein product [Digitaria exilis]